MARAQYIYEVREAGPEESTMALFTVKHEMAEWLYRHARFAPVYWTCWRHIDAGWRAADPVHLGTARELMEEYYA